MTNAENPEEEIVIEQKEQELNIHQAEDNSEENNEKPKTKDASSKGENQEEEEGEEEEEEKEAEVQEIKVVQQKEDDDDDDENDNKDEKENDKDEKEDENENENKSEDKNDNNQQGEVEIKLGNVQDIDDDDIKKPNMNIDLEPGLNISVEYFKVNDNMDIILSTTSKKKLVLHWGVSNKDNIKQWNLPNDKCYPPLTDKHDDFSLNTEFSYLENDDVEQKIHIRLPLDSFDVFNFVFFLKDENKWLNNNEQDYHIKNE